MSNIEVFDGAEGVGSDADDAIQRERQTLFRDASVPSSVAGLNDAGIALTCGSSCNQGSRLAAVHAYKLRNFAAHSAVRLRERFDDGEMVMRWRHVKA